MVQLSYRRYPAIVADTALLENLLALFGIALVTGYGGQR